MRRLQPNLTRSPVVRTCLVDIQGFRRTDQISAERLDSKAAKAVSRFESIVGAISNSLPSCSIFVLL